MMKTIAVTLTVAIGLLPLCRSLSGEQPASPAGPWRALGNIDRANLIEPSGLVFHPIRKTLFAVGDQGDICEFATDGRVLRKKRIQPADLEGLAVNPATGLLYVASEGRDRILEVDPETLRILRLYTIERTFRGKTVMDIAGNGIEGIAFVPNAAHPEGGTFFVANQSFDMNCPHDPSALFEVEAPLTSCPDQDATIPILRFFSIGYPDLSSVSFNPEDQTLIVVSDMSNMIVQVSLEGTVLSESACPGRDQEGLAFDDNGNLYIAQDSGGIVKFAHGERGNRGKDLEK